MNSGGIAQEEGLGAGEEQRIYILIPLKVYIKHRQQSLLQKNKAIKYKVVLFFLSIAFIYLLFNNILPKHLEIPYNKYVWENFPKYRYSMSESVVRKINADQLSYNEVKQLLGNPDEGSDNIGLSYFLRSNALIGPDSDWLEIHFTDSSTYAQVYNFD